MKPKRVVLGEGYLSTDGINVALHASCPCGLRPDYPLELESKPWNGSRVRLVAEVLSERGEGR